ncbi:MucR family transcriptional regulator [Methylobacterium iners]|uniref:MucR family transcriptional regulator n=1 Tax=Methylobacterium iners TaxID=418707 RepID=UPI001EE2FE96
MSLEDGRAYKPLKRHLTGRGLSPDSYRAKYGLPPDYPMTAPTYSAARAALAQSIGLGRKGEKPTAKSAEVAETISEVATTRAG